MTSQLDHTTKYKTRIAAHEACKVILLGTRLWPVLAPGYRTYMDLLERVQHRAAAASRPYLASARRDPQGSTEIGHYVGYEREK